MAVRTSRLTDPQPFSEGSGQESKSCGHQIAIWGAREVRCYSPTGLQLATLEADAPNVSSVAFVGQELDILLITTASEQLSPSELAQYPNSGRLFSCRVGVHGLPVPYWSGLGGPVTVDRPD